MYGTNLHEDPLQYYPLSAGDRPAFMPVWSLDASFPAWIEYDRHAQTSFFDYLRFVQ